jgi:DNA-binding NtrC family response regulator
VTERRGPLRFLDPTERVDPPAPMPLTLLVLGPEGTSHALPRSGSVTIGRAPEMHVRIDDPSVSRRHATLFVEPELALVDDGSQNGVRIRNERIPPNERIPVSLGEPMRLGNVTVVVFGEGASAPVNLTPFPIPTSPSSPRAIMTSPAMTEVRELVKRVAPSELNVLIAGETGAGKEIVAEILHAESRRHASSLVKLNCGALATSVVESELFGHERGAFTGAASAKEGLLEIAAGGTLFLDEIGELPLATQAKLLRVIEDRSVLRVGATAPRPIDCRFVAATNRNLAEEIRAGRFRSDLYFRLNGVTVIVPPLRERREEVRPLALHFAALARERHGIARASELGIEVLGALERYAWPGNVRELRNVVERAVVLASGGPVTVAHLPPEVAGAEIGEWRAPPAPPSLGAEQLADRERILRALAQSSGNQKRAAELLGMSRRTLINRLETYGIPRPRKS